MPAINQNQSVLPITVENPNVQNATKTIEPLVKAADLEREQLEQEKQDNKDLREAIERDGEKRGKYRVLKKYICFEKLLTCIFTVFPPSLLYHVSDQTSFHFEGC